MASTRLNKELKEDILDALIARTFSKKRDALRKARKDFALELYNSLYPPEMLARMKALPDGFFRTTLSLRVNDDSWQGKEYKFDDPKIIAACHNGKLEKSQIGPAMYDKHEKQIDKERKLKTAIDEASAKAMSVMNSVSTVKRLIEVWPDIKKIAEPFDIGVASINVPAIRIEELNKAFELPPEEVV